MPGPPLAPQGIINVTGINEGVAMGAAVDTSVLPYQFESTFARTLRSVYSGWLVDTLVLWHTAYRRGPN